MFDSYRRGREHGVRVQALSGVFSLAPLTFFDRIAIADLNQLPYLLG
jgi:hypothetical protein